MTLTQVSTNGIKDGEIVNADINASAAITGSKLADDSISLAKLEHGTSSNDGKFLRANNGADPSFETVSIPAGTTINNNANNRVITGSGTANTLEAEANLTFDGSGQLSIGHTDPKIALVDTTNNTDAYIFSDDNGSLRLQADQNSEASDTRVRIQTDGIERVSIDSNLKIFDGNLIIGTNGHGIDFSATPNPGQTGTTQDNELFSDYEEGTWSPEYNAGSASSACFASGVSYSTQVGVYRKIGKMVYFILKIQASSGTAKSGQLQINRLPFSAGDFSSNATAGGAYITLTNAFTNSSHMPTAFISGSQSNIKFFQTNANAWAGTDLDTPTGFIHLAGAYPTST